MFCTLNAKPSSPCDLLEQTQENWYQSLYLSWVLHLARGLRWWNWSNPLICGVVMALFKDYLKSKKHAKREHSIVCVNWLHLWPAS